MKTENVSGDVITITDNYERYYDIYSDERYDEDGYCEICGSYES